MGILQTGMQFWVSIQIDSEQKGQVTSTSCVTGLNKWLPRLHPQKCYMVVDS